MSFSTSTFSFLNMSWRRICTIPSFGYCLYWALSLSHYIFFHISVAVFYDILLSYLWGPAGQWVIGHGMGWSWWVYGYSFFFP